MIKRSEMLPAIAGFFIACAISFIVIEWRAEAPITQYHQVTAPEIVTKGDTITVTWKEIRNRECDSIVSRMLIDSDGDVVQFATVNIPAKPTGVELMEAFQFKVPEGLDSGRLIYRVRVEFICNFVQRILGGHVFVMPDVVFFYTDNKKEGYHP